MRLIMKQWNDYIDEETAIESAMHADPIFMVNNYLPSLCKLMEEEADKHLPYGFSGDDKEKYVSNKMKWHLRRMSGFGGSDMGILYSESKGIKSPFTSTREIIKGKQGVSLPNPSSGDTRRGTILEDHIKDQFLKQYDIHGIKEYPNSDSIIKEWMNNGGSDEHTWLQCNPDFVGINKDNEIVVIDFKAPASEDVAASYQTHVPENYKAQIETGAIVFEEACGLSTSQRMVVSMGPKFEIYLCPFDVEPTLRDELFKLGDENWEHVEDGTLPEFKKDGEYKKLDGDSLSQPLQNTIEEFVLLNKIQSDSKKRADKLKVVIEEMLKDHGLTLDDYKDDKFKAAVGLINMTVTQRSSWDMDKIKSLISESGFDENDFKKTTPTKGLSVKRAKDPALDEISDSVSMKIDEIVNDKRKSTKEYDTNSPQF